MKELKEKIDKLFYVLKKIDINITNSASTSVDKIIDIIHTAAITASNLVIDTAAITASNTETIFDNNMYIKCLIHEIRTPITNIILGINSIENNIKEFEKNNELLNTIDSLYKSLNFIEDILTKFCVIKNGIMVLNIYEPFSINKLMNDIENLLQYNINEKNIQFKCNINANVRDMVYGDVVNIKHCIVNLIKNSIKYSNQNNDIIIINITNLNEDKKYQSIVISVLDNNNHIPKDIKDKLFQPFNSTSGSGLGLYICKKILKLHNGSIEHEYINNNDGNQFNIFIDFEIQHDLNLEENNIIECEK